MNHDTIKLLTIKIIQNNNKHNDQVLHRNFQEPQTHNPNSSTPVWRRLFENMCH